MADVNKIFMTVPTGLNRQGAANQVLTALDVGMVESVEYTVDAAVCQVVMTSGQSLRVLWSKEKLFNEMERVVMLAEQGRYAVSLAEQAGQELTFEPPVGASDQDRGDTETMEKVYRG